MTMRPEWRKSSRSASTDSCVEVSRAKSAIRDSKNLDGPQLRIVLTDLLAAVKSDRLLFEVDPHHGFGGLRRVMQPTGEFAWICPVHTPVYDPGLPELPPSVSG